MKGLWLLSFQIRPLAIFILFFEGFLVRLDFYPYKYPFWNMGTAFERQSLLERNSLDCASFAYSHSHVSLNGG